MFDIAITVGICTLAGLHAAFFWKALHSTAIISKRRRSKWAALSLALGPVGYYFYLGILPCDLISEE